MEGQEDSPSTPKGQPDDKFCAFCAYPGDYDLLLHGMYLDFSWSFGGEEASAEVMPEIVSEDPPFAPVEEAAPAPVEEAAPAPVEEAAPAQEPSVEPVTDDAP